MKSLVWIASYPKSGNTWLRTFLSNLRRDSDEPVDIDALDRTPIASARDLLDDLVACELSNLTASEVERLRPDAYEVLARREERPRLFKVHDACIETVDGHRLFPADATRGALYVVRHPYDVAVSLSHQVPCTLDAAIAVMADPEFCLGGFSDRPSLQVRQRVTTWNRHVTSWLRAPFPVCVLRYEDMLAEPIVVFSKAARFLELPTERARVAKAVAHSGFDVLSAQERDHGFREKGAQVRRFFREGRAGAGREQLTRAQRDSILDVHGPVMDQLGYTDEGTRRLESDGTSVSIASARAGELTE